MTSHDIQSQLAAAQSARDSLRARRAKRAAELGRLKIRDLHILYEDHIRSKRNEVPSHDYHRRIGKKRLIALLVDAELPNFEEERLAWALEEHVKRMED